jgi:hypothetical protein
MRSGLDAHASPPQHIRDLYKFYQKLKYQKGGLIDGVVDFEALGRDNGLNVVEYISRETVVKVSAQLVGSNFENAFDQKKEQYPVYEHRDIPGSPMSSL